MPDSKPRIIAFYLPQFHPIPENDKWWGKGFTEWMNVGKAKPLFPGHKQPKVPTELGYYDLRLKSNYKLQIELAKEAGVEGFCFWHYYFGDGKQLLQKPVQSVLNDKSLDFPFCLGWANESWEKKLWNKDASKNILLMEQKYNGKKDYKQHFDIVYQYLEDSRYIEVDNKPVFLIYRPNQFQDISSFINYWNELLYEKNGKHFHFIAHADEKENAFEKYFEKGFDAVYSNRVQAGAQGLQYNFLRTIQYSLCKFFLLPRIVNFKSVVEMAINKDDCQLNIYPGIICGWDHTPRSGRKGYVYVNFTLELFKHHIISILNLVKDKPPQNQIVFLKSWNEWGEGNFMEPDLEFGKGKIAVLAKCLKNINH